MIKTLSLIFGMLVSVDLKEGRSEAVSQKPPELEGVIQSDTPYGETLLSKMVFDVYNIALWTDSPTWSQESKYALSIQYLMDFTKDQLVEMTLDEMKRLGAPFDVNQYRSQLEKLFKDVKEGDRITATFSPQGKTTIYYNGVMQGAIENPDFTRFFGAIWMSENTQEPEMRKNLLRKQKMSEEET